MIAFLASGLLESPIIYIEDIIIDCVTEDFACSALNSGMRQQNTAPSLKIHKLIWNRVNEIQCENVPKNKVSFQHPNNCAFVITVANL